MSRELLQRGSGRLDRGGGLTGCIGNTYGGDIQGYLHRDTRERPPRQVLTHRLRCLADAAQVGDVAVGDAVGAVDGELVAVRHLRQVGSLQV